MKKNYILLTFICLAQITIAQLTVTTNPSNAGICAGNSVTITASAVPLGYTASAISNNPFDPNLFTTIVLVDQTNTSPVPLSFGTLDDGRWDNIALPFSFVFYGNTFNAINISTNGWIGLGSTNTTATGYGVALPNAAAPNNVIHAITCDLDFKPTINPNPPNPAVLQYFEAGVSPNRKFVIDYSNIKFFSGAASADVQVILYETTNVIEIHTSSCNNTTTPKAQGIENSNGTVAAVATGRNNTTNWSGMPDAYRFTPDNITYSWSPATGLNTTTGATVIASPATTTTYTVSAINTVNSQAGNTSVTVTVDAASYVLAASAGGPQVCQNISVSSSGTSYRDGNCNLIATIVPSGGSPVSNSVFTCVKVDTGSTKRGTSVLYAARQYDIEPLLNPYPATSTANITLYYLQTEFNNYNTKATDSGHKLLPTGPADVTGISNLLLRQFHGTGTNPTNYTGSSEDFTTATSGLTVNWNASRSWWEVNVPVTGFSGFYLSSALVGVLPIRIEYFKGVQVDNKHLLTWKANCSSSSVTFEVQRSIDGSHFNTIEKITASQARCSQPFDFTDEHPASGMNYYRIKIIDIDAKSNYSNMVLLILKTKGIEILSLSPNPVARENAVIKINSGEKSQVNIIITDFTGRVVRNQISQLIPGINHITLNTLSLSKGAYQLVIYSETELYKTMRLIKQ